jgi:aminopeptidase N
VRDPFLRALLWDGLWESVREAELPPLDYIEMALRELPKERDEVTVSGILARVQTAFRWYLSDAQQAALASRLEAALRAGMLGAPETGLRIICFRAFAAVATSGKGRADLERLLSGQQVIPGVTLSSNDRFRVIRRLLTLNDAAGERLLAAQSQADRTDDGSARRRNRRSASRRHDQRDYSTRL